MCISNKQHYLGEKTCSYPVAWEKLLERTWYEYIDDTDVLEGIVIVVLLGSSIHDGLWKCVSLSWAGISLP